jgi:hypothetical protein
VADSLLAAVRKEELEAWRTSTAALKRRVTDLSQELLGTYQELTGKLVDLFSRCDAADKAVAQINHSAPGIVHRLYGVEATLTNGRDTRIIPKVKLPKLSVDGRTSVDAWPLPVIPIGVAMHDHVQAMMRGARPVSEAERIAESARVVAFGEEQERGRVRLNEEAAARTPGPVFPAAARCDDGGKLQRGSSPLVSRRRSASLSRTRSAGSCAPGGRRSPGPRCGRRLGLPGSREPDMHALHVGHPTALAPAFPAGGTGHAGDGDVGFVGVVTHTTGSQPNKLVYQRMGCGCGVSFRQLQTCRATRPGRQWADL